MNALDFLPSLWEGDAGYRAPQASHAVEDVYVLPAQAPPSRMVKMKCKPEHIELVRANLSLREWTATVVFNRIIAGGDVITFEEVSSALAQLLRNGAVVRTRHRPKNRIRAVYLWRLKGRET